MSGRILVVEDNPDNMKLVSWLLEDEGFDFDGATSAEAAMQVLEQHKFDLILMDVSLPGMNGKEATRHLRSDPRFAALPIIAVTAHAVKGEEDAIWAAGVDGLVTKPIDDQVLLQTIRSCLRQGGES